VTACTPLTTTTGLASADTARLCVQFYKNTEPWLYILLFTKTLLHSEGPPLQTQLIRSSGSGAVRDMLVRCGCDSLGGSSVLTARKRQLKIVKISKNHDATPIHAKCIDSCRVSSAGGADRFTAVCCCGVGRGTPRGHRHGKIWGTTRCQFAGSEI